MRNPLVRRTAPLVLAGALALLGAACDDGNVDVEISPTPDVNISPAPDITIGPGEESPTIGTTPDTGTSPDTGLTDTESPSPIIGDTESPTG